jgi:hypothetical protein
MRGTKNLCYVLFIVPTVLIRVALLPPNALVPDGARRSTQAFANSGGLTAWGSGLAIGSPMKRRALSPMKS